MNNNLKSGKFNIDSFTMQIIILCIVIILALVTCLFNPSSVNLVVFVIFVSTICAVFVAIREMKNKRRRINEISSSMNDVLKDNLKIIDIPMAMVTNTTDIIWQNNLCMHSIPEEYIVLTAIDIAKKKESLETLKSQVVFGEGNVYEGIGNYISFSDYSCLLITFVDKNKEYELNKIIDSTKVTVGMVFVDNYEETMQGLDEILKIDIATKIDKEIRKWVQDNFGVIAKIDKDKYAIFIEKQYVKGLEDSSFTILEKVRNLTNVTKLPITISIGMSYSDPSLNARYVSASSALDIALGRGGDQAVIKNDKRFEFYGGTNLGLEKTSRVRARTIAQALKDLMEKSDNIYIIGHKNTDIDCIGSAIGVYKIAKSLGKQANIIVDAKYNNTTKLVMERLKSKKEYEGVFWTKEDTKKIDYDNALLVVVDTHKKTYLAVNDVLDDFDKVVVIDHHRRGPEFIDNALLTYHELYSSSTAELVCELLMYLEDIKLSPVEAETIYAGILVDTKNFTFKTGVRTFEVAAYLKKSGLDISEVKHIFQSDFDTYVIKVEIVKNAEILDEKIAISMTEEEHDNMPVIAAQAADELLSITGIVASFVLCKVDNVIMISGRSMGDINVQAIMEGIGGGGHLTFAGAQIAGITIEEAKSRLIESINNYFGKIKDKEKDKSEQED